MDVSGVAFSPPRGGVNFLLSDSEQERVICSSLARRSGCCVV